MKNTEKELQEKISGILLQNTPPSPDRFRKDSFLKTLSERACSMDYLAKQNIWETLFAQCSHMSPWSFLLMAVFLAFLFVFSLIHALDAAAFCMLSLSPILTGTLIYELSKSFDSKMWEMETACRYNLAKLFFLRICILSGTNFIVLAASLTIFSLTGGMIWQFACYTLLPYFLISALCLWLLQHFGNRYRSFVLSTACLSSIFIEIMLLSLPEEMFHSLDTAALNTVSILASMGALVLFLLCTFRLCTRKHFANMVPGTLHL